jgi:hypothetical protein
VDGAYFRVRHSARPAGLAHPRRRGTEYVDASDRSSRPKERLRSVVTSRIAKAYGYAPPEGCITGGILESKPDSRGNHL